MSNRLGMQSTMATTDWPFVTEIFVEMLGQW